MKSIEVLVADTCWGVSVKVGGDAPGRLTNAAGRAMTRINATSSSKTLIQQQRLRCQDRLMAAHNLQVAGMALFLLSNRLSSMALVPCCFQQAAR